MARTNAYIALILCVFGALLAGCSQNSDKGEQSETVAEGVIFSVEFKLENGKTEGFTRANSALLVPGSSGSWNIDAYGRLTRDFLIITYPQQKELGPKVIPTSRLVSIQFGDGGLKTISKETAMPK